MRVELLNKRNKIVEEIETISGFKRNPEGFYMQVCSKWDSR